MGCKKNGVRIPNHFHSYVQYTSFVRILIFLYSPITHIITLTIINCDESVSCGLPEWTSFTSSFPPQEEKLIASYVNLQLVGSMTDSL